MSRALTRQVAQIRGALMAGNAQAALAGLDELTRIAARRGIDTPTRDLLEPALADLRALAQASLKGAQQVPNRCAPSCRPHAACRPMIPWVSAM